MAVNSSPHLKQSHETTCSLTTQSSPVSASTGAIASLITSAPNSPSSFVQPQQPLSRKQTYTEMMMEKKSTLQILAFLPLVFLYIYLGIAFGCIRIYLTPLPFRCYTPIENDPIFDELKKSDNGRGYRKVEQLLLPDQDLNTNPRRFESPNSCKKYSSAHVQSIIDRQKGRNITMEQFNQYIGEMAEEPPKVENCGGLGWQFVKRKDTIEQNLNTKYKLVCERMVLLNTLNSLGSLGQLLGSAFLVFGDIIGRSFLFLIASFIHAAAGFLMLMMPTFMSYVICFMFYMGAAITMFALGLIAACEFWNSSPNKRIVSVSSLGMSFGVGIGIAGWLSLHTTDWLSLHASITTCYLCITALLFPLISFISNPDFQKQWEQLSCSHFVQFLFTSSVRYRNKAAPPTSRSGNSLLLSTGGSSNFATGSLNNSTSMSDEPVTSSGDHNWWWLTRHPMEYLRNSIIFRLYNHNGFRFVSWLLILNWTANTVVYYSIGSYRPPESLRLLPPTLEWSLYEGGFYETVSIFMYLIIAVVWKDRIKTYCLFLTVCGASRTFALFFHSLPTLEFTLTRLSSITSPGAFNGLYLLTIELLPDCHRCTLLGISSAGGRLAGVVLPYLVPYFDTIFVNLIWMICGCIAVGAGLSSLLITGGARVNKLCLTFEDCVNQKMFYTLLDFDEDQRKEFQRRKSEWKTEKRLENDIAQKLYRRSCGTRVSMEREHQIVNR